jgi:AcrR family transcriptional regulator
MANNDNSVNIEKRPYHHGDLRAALIAEALGQLQNRDVDSLSLREVARSVGVSATSVYRHFPDKGALLTAVAREGLVRLAAAQREAAESESDGKAAFAATGRAYVRFALANPALFRLVFASPALAHEDKTGLGAEDEAMRMLRRNVAELEHRTLDDPETAVAAARAWALVHGLAMLMLDGQIAVDDALIDRVIVPEG